MHDIEVKSILSARNGMNLYRGCTHGCIYCDSRSVCYGIDHVFEDIAVKVNAIELLENALKHKKNRCMIGTGSMCDPYMHCEERVMLTRRALEVIDRYGFGVSVITKSDRVMRDIDLFEKINLNTKAVLQMTLTTFDEELCGIIEPRVCTTHRRYEVLKEFHKRGMPTIVWLCPILPFINDTAENLNGILDYCFDAQVTGILNFGFGVTLREGDREYFYQKLDEHFPGIKSKYIRKYGNAYECESDNSEMLYEIFKDRCRHEGVMYSPKKIFEFLDEFPDNNEQISLF